MKYDPQAIEKKWQHFWQERKTFVANISHKPKYYVLDMFPYPSGAGLHVGHLVGYTATDVIARYKKACGYEVLHPMGWDSFGLPAEQYAIRTGTHPRATTATNIRNFKEQLQSLGYAYDWEREIMTSDPSYYKWTQYLFTKLYERGLAYQAELLVNYCPILGTVLANEEVEEGRAKEGGYPIERRPLKQWVLKITSYADRLLEDLDALDWPDGLKKLQINWIGKSEGAHIHFPVEGHEEKITIFTTRPDTLFGVTYLVLAPEHPMVAKIVTPDQQEKVTAYQKICAQKSDLERTELAKDKSGLFTGAYAIHVATQQRIPIWIADFVLGHYGSGAVMAVPAHDERDFVFAKTHDLPIIAVIAPEEEEMKKELFSGKRCWAKREGICEKSEDNGLTLNGLPVEEAIKRVIEWLESRGYGEGVVNYKLRDWLFSRQRYWGEPFPILHFADGSMRALGKDELPLMPPEIIDFTPSGTGESPLAKVKEWVEIEDPVTKKQAHRETNTMPQWAGSCWYYLRFLDPHNDKEPWSKENERYWMPVDLYVGGAEHAVLHLLYARFWHKVFYDCGIVSGKEPFQKLCNQGIVVSRSYQNQQGHYVSPEEVVEKEGEYFHWQSNELLTSQIEKMSKSKLNGIPPNELITQYGADALRLYILFMGPVDKEKVWNNKNVSGCSRFLHRFFELATSDKVKEHENKESMRLAHRLVAGITCDLDQLLFNTAIAKFMEFLNAISKLETIGKEALCIAIQVLAPFAPHMAEELWQYWGKNGSVIEATWPVVDPSYLVEEMVTYVVQVNGKLRGRFELPKDRTEEDILALAHAHPSISHHLKGEIVKVVFVPNKLLNLVIK